MCMIDGCDERMTPLTDVIRRAKKAHQCCECRRQIQPGESYQYYVGTIDRLMETYKTCQHCLVVKEWLLKECDGWVFEFCQDDLMEHVEEGIYGMAVARLYVNMERDWTNTKGELLPVPACPLSTVEKQKAREVTVR